MRIIYYLLITGLQNGESYLNSVFLFKSPLRLASCLLPVAASFVWQQHTGLYNQRSSADRFPLPGRKQTRSLLTDFRLNNSPFLFDTMVRMEVCFRRGPLIIWLSLVSALGLVVGMGEDLDRPLFGPPGSLIRLHESDPGLRKALLFVEERYNRGSNAVHLRKVSRFVSATKQVTLL